MDINKSILLESGTNEVELLEIICEDQSFGINVEKIKEIIIYDPQKVVRMPNTHRSVIGSYHYRDQTFNLIDLTIHMNKKSPEGIRRIIVVTEFNNMINGFVADNVSAIRRFSWSDITPLDSFTMQNITNFTGNVQLDSERLMLILDLEQIISRLFDEGRLKGEDIDKAEDKLDLRKVKKILIAEDSHVIRKTMVKLLKESGYSDLTAFDNGKSALDHIVSSLNLVIKEGMSNAKSYLDNGKIDLIITDIEMPQMDGLTLCRKLKEEYGLDIPILIFSSLVNQQVIIKCQSVGADGYLSKPKIGELVKLVDQKLQV